MSYLFIRDNYNGLVLVANKEWFKQVSTCELYNDYGIIEGDDHEIEGECGHETVLCYQNWNGSNMQSVVLDDSRFSVIEDQPSIEAYKEVLEVKEYIGESTGIKRFSAPGYLIKKSFWQGDWELFSIYEDDEIDSEVK